MGDNTFLYPGKCVGMLLMSKNVQINFQIQPDISL
jgi:hypothetical protein